MGKSGNDDNNVIFVEVSEHIALFSDAVVPAKSLYRNQEIPCK